MFRIFIVLVLIIGASSGVLFTNAYLSFQQSKTNLIERDRLFMRDIKNQLVQSVLKDESSGLLMLPYGQNVEGEHVLPSWLHLPQKNPFGNNYIYCPYGEVTGTYNNTVAVTDTTQYGVGIINNADTNNNSYVMSSEPSIANNILGVVISNHDEANAINCNSLSYNDNLFYGSHSFVEVIYKDSILYNDLIKESYFNIKDSAELNSTLNVVSSRLNDKTTLNLMGDFNSPGVVFNNDYKSKKTLFLKSSNNILGASIPVTYEFNNMNVYVEDLNLSNNIKIILNNSVLYTRNATITNLNSSNSEINLNNTQLSPTEDIILNNTELNINNNVDWNFNTSELVALGGDINIHNSNYTINYTNSGGNANTSILNLLDSDLMVNDSTISYLTSNGESLLSYGLNSSINKYNTSIEALGNSQEIIYGRGNVSNYNVNYSGGVSAITGEMGSNIALNNTTLNTSGSGIVDNGIMSLSGYGNTINSSICIMGELGEDGRNVEGEVDYESYNAGPYSTLGESITLTPETKVINLSVDVAHMFKDIDVTCNTL